MVNLVHDDCSWPNSTTAATVSRQSLARDAYPSSGVEAEPGRSARGLLTPDLGLLPLTDGCDVQSRTTSDLGTRIRVRIGNGYVFDGSDAIFPVKREE